MSTNIYHRGPILQWAMLDDSTAQGYLPENPGFPLFLFEWDGSPGGEGAKGLLTGTFGPDVEDLAELYAFELAETLLIDWCTKHALRVISAAPRSAHQRHVAGIGQSLSHSLKESASALFDVTGLQPLR